MFKIEKGVSLKKRGIYKEIYPFKEMEIGDSFLIECKDVEKEKMRSYVYTHFTHYRAVDNNFKISTRKEKNGIRVWRIEDI